MKLGFVAMSGVRAQNKELMEFGLTLPGFIERSKVVASLPSLGLLILAGMTPSDIELEYLEVPNIEDVDLRRPPGNFDVVAISGLSAQIKDAYRLADSYRAAGVIVLLGGLHVSALPGEAGLHADAVIVGEGEPAWPSVIDDLRRGRVQPLYNNAGLHTFDFSEAPMPRYDLLQIDRYNRLTVQTQRGCPFRCDFCAASIRISPTYKIKPVDKVMREIRYIKQLWPKPFIEFADDNSFVNKQRSKELLRKLSDEHVRWFTESDVSIGEDDELLYLMRESGCAQVLIGFESPSYAALDGLELRANWKARQLDRYCRAIDRIQSHGITVNGCFILGLDGSDRTSFENVWQFVKDSGLYEVQITVLTPFPGTPLYERLKSQGRLLEENAWERCTLFDVNFKPTHMTVAELESGFRELGTKLYSAEFTKQRREGYRRQLRRRRHEAALCGGSQ